MSVTMEQTRKQTDKEIIQEIAQRRKELFDLRVLEAVQKLDDTSIKMKTKRGIARLLTILRERQLVQAASATTTSLQRDRWQPRSKRSNKKNKLAGPRDNFRKQKQDLVTCFVAFDQSFSRAHGVIAEYRVGDRPKPYRFAAVPNTFLMDVSEKSRERLQREGAEVFPDIQFQRFDPDNYSPWDGTATEGQFGNMTQVMEQIRAPQARATEGFNGSGTYIAIIDSGVSKTMAELPSERCVDFDAPGSFFEGRHWFESGHGSMCAAIAASSGGRHIGVAPRASVISARTNFKSGDLAILFDRLFTMKINKIIPGPLIISNSWGIPKCQQPTFTTAPGQPPTVISDRFSLFNIIAAMVNSNIPVIFAAGNSHYTQLCKFSPTADKPNTIWGPASMDSVFTVGTVNRAFSNTDGLTPHGNSSRGPGEWHKAFPKPDVVCPTYGEVCWGTQKYRNMAWWGSSGAAPQVAGLASVMLSKDPTLTPSQIGALIRRTCQNPGASPLAIGSGIIDCQGALSAV
jgi:serine protease AprX